MGARLDPAVFAPLSAALCYGIAAVVQQAGARRAAGSVDASGRPGPGPGLAEGPPAGGRALGLGLLLDLLRQPLFLLGLGLDAVGFFLAFLGLRSLPVFVVEAAVASTVAVTALLGSRYLSDRLGRREWALVGAVVVGLALVGASAAPGERPALGRSGRLLLVGGVPAVALAALALDRRRTAVRAAAGDPARADRRSSAALGAVSGVGFGAFALAARLIPSHHGLGGLLADPVLWAAVAYAAVGLAIYGAALQHGSVTAVTAAAIAVEALFPSALGLLLGSDGTRPGLAGAAAAGFALTVVSALALAVSAPAAEETDLEPAVT